jgi:hypothetical protein
MHFMHVLCMNFMHIFRALSRDITNQTKKSLEYRGYIAVKGIFITLRLRLWIHHYTYNMQILCKIMYKISYRFFMIVIHSLSTYFIHKLSTYVCIFWTENNYRQSEHYLISLSSEEICSCFCYMVIYILIDYISIKGYFSSYRRKIRMEHKCNQIVLYPL